MNKIEQRQQPINLNKGDSFRFNNRIWKVTEIYKIKWKDGTRSNEYKLKSNSSSIRFLEEEIDKNKKISYSFWQKEQNKDNILSKTQDFSNGYVSIGKAKFSKTFSYNGVHYIFDERNDGTCRTGFESEIVNALEYTNEDDTRLLAFELWDDEIEVSTGYPITKARIQNIQRKKTRIERSGFSDYVERNFQMVAAAIIFVILVVMSKCSNKNSWNDNNGYNNDSTKVHRNSNSYYRGRSSRGYGK